MERKLNDKIGSENRKGMPNVKVDRATRVNKWIEKENRAKKWRKSSLRNGEKIEVRKVERN